MSSIQNFKVVGRTSKITARHKFHLPKRRHHHRFFKGESFSAFATMKVASSEDSVKKSFRSSLLSEQLMVEFNQLAIPFSADH